MIKKLKKCFLSILTIGLVISSINMQVFAENTASKITIDKLTASSEYSGNKIDLANDGTTSTFWETNWQGDNYTASESNPIVVTAEFNEMKAVGIMRIIPRQGDDVVNGGDANGRFIKAKYTLLGEDENVIRTWTETYETTNGYPSSDAVDVNINETVRAVKIEVLQAYHTTVTMAELEFYEKTEEVSTNGIASYEANTEENAHDNGIEKAFDNDTSTFWHSAWSGFTVSESNPAVIILTRDSENPMSELQYTTRPGGQVDGDQNGNIKKMNIYTSQDKQTWTKLTSVEWDITSGTKTAQMLGNTDRYVKLEIVEGYRGNASAAEFKITHLSGIEDIDTSLIDEVKELGISEGHYQGWEEVSAQALLVALQAAEDAKSQNDIAALISALTQLDQAYKALVVDKQPLIDKIEEARNVDCVGKNPTSIATLNRAIENASEALETVTTPLEVAFEVTQLSEAMLLSDEPVKDIQTVSNFKDLQRENNFNDGWLFKETTDASYTNDLDESQFTSVTLPHDFSISKDFTVSGEAESGFLLGGTGWYRKHIVVPEDAKDKNFNLVFDGAYMDTTVYVNGQKMGENHNGYNQFAFDITSALVCDGKTDNVIAVKVVNNLPSSRWYSGSGIYRDVTLQVTDQTHIDYLGTFVSTPQVSQDSATVQIQNTIVGRNDNTTIQTVIYDKDNQVVKESAIENVTSDTVTQTLTVNQPTLWSVNTDHPALYKAITTVYKDGVQVDQVEEQFGFKTVTFTRDEGLFLNGENIKLKGVCMHHDQGALGAATNYHAVYRQMKIMKDMGANAIRVTHNPASEVLLDVCDELGLLVVNEAFDHFYYSKNNNYNDFARWFKVEIGESQLGGATASMTWAEYVARQMVRTSRNHASILMYSVGNELLEGGSSDDGYIQTVADICQWFKEEDPYHKPTIGDNKAKANDTRAVALCEEVHKAGGIVGFNYASQAQYDDLRAAHPDWILYGSETSSAFHSRNVYNTNGNDESKKLCTDYENETSRAGWGHSASTAWKYVEENDWNVGEFVWTGFDYIGEPTPWNGIGVGSVSGIGAVPRSSFFGIVETTGFAKDIYYLYQSLWNDDVRTLHMTESWNENLVKNGNQVTIQVFSDADVVKLYLDGEEIASQSSTIKANGQRKFGDKYFAEFQVEYQPGTLTAKAFNSDGSEITNTVGRNKVATTKTATKTELSADKTTLNSDGYDLAYVTVDLLDSQNNFVSDNNQKLYFTLEGEGRIVGVDNGNQSDSQTFRIDDPTQVTRNAFNGKALVIIQSTKRAGDIKLQVKGVGLETNTITLKSSTESTSQTLSALEFVSKYTTIVNQDIQLPETVTGILESGKTEELTVEWDLSTLDITKAGTYVVKGKVENFDVYASASVYVYNQFAGAQDYTTVMHEGTVISLPASRKVYYDNGDVAGEFPVVWKYYDTTTYQAGQTYTVEGTILIADTRLPVTAKIRVVDPLPESRNIARLESDLPALAQSCQNTADNLNSLNNGVKVSTSPNERWTDWNQQDEQKPWVSYTWANEYTISDVIAYIYQDSTSACCTPRELELELETLNSNGEWVKQEISYITPVAYNDGDGKTTINLKNPVTTNGIRLSMKKPSVNTFTGLTELEVFEHIERITPNANCSMTSITLDQYTVENFTPEVENYEIIVDELPNVTELQVTPNGIDETSSYIVLKDNETKTIHVIIRAEDGSEKTYTFALIEKEKVSIEELQKLYDEAMALDAKEFTESSYDVLKKALSDAKKVLDNKQATQADVDEALLQLNNARSQLQRVDDSPMPDKTALILAIQKAEELKAEEYTTDTWSLFETALSSANAIVVDKNANQEQVNNILKELDNAMNHLVKRADTREAENLLNEIKDKNLDESQYTEESWKAYQEALSALESAVKDTSNISEENMTSFINTLRMALNELEKKPEEPTPTEPADPVEPEEPTPTEPTDPVDPEEPTPTEPTNPVEPEEPTPTEPTDPVDPEEPILTDPTNPTDSEQPISSEKPSTDTSDLAPISVLLVVMILTGGYVFMEYRKRKHS